MDLIGCIFKVRMLRNAAHWEILNQYIYEDGSLTRETYFSSSLGSRLQADSYLAGHVRSCFDDIRYSMALSTIDRVGKDLEYDFILNWDPVPPIFPGGNAALKNLSMRVEVPGDDGQQTTPDLLSIMNDVCRG